MIRSVEVRTEATLHKPAEKNIFELGYSTVVMLLIDCIHLLNLFNFCLIEEQEENCWEY